MEQATATALIFKDLLYRGKIKNQAEFGKALGYKPSFTSRLLAGKEKEPGDLRKKLSETFGLTADEIDSLQGIKKPDPVKEPGDEWREKYYATLEEKAALIDKLANRSIQLADRALERLSEVERTADDNALMIQGIQEYVTLKFAAVVHADPLSIADELDTVLIRLGQERKKDRIKHAHT